MSLHSFETWLCFLGTLGVLEVSREPVRREALREDAGRPLRSNSSSPSTKRNETNRQSRSFINNFRLHPHVRPPRPRFSFAFRPGISNTPARPGRQSVPNPNFPHFFAAPKKSVPGHVPSAVALAVAVVPGRWTGRRPNKSTFCPC